MIQEHGSASTGGLSKEELGRLVASRWTGEKFAEKDENPKDESQKVHTDDVAEPAEEEENYDSYNSDTEDDRYKYKDHEDEHKYDDEYDGDSDEEYSSDHADTADAADSYKSDDEYNSDHSGQTFIYEFPFFLPPYFLVSCPLLTVISKYHQLDKSSYFFLAWTHNVKDARRNFSPSFTFN